MLGSPVESGYVLPEQQKPPHEKPLPEMVGSLGRSRWRSTSGKVKTRGH
jgi:hypothetical protein